MKSSLNKFLYLWAGFLLVFIPLYPKFPLFNVPGTYVAIRLEDFLILITALITLSLYLKSPAKKIIKKNILLPAGAFLLVGLISLIQLVFVYKINFPWLAWLHWLRRIEYIVPLFLFASLKINKKLLNKYLVTIILTTLLIDIYGLGQKIWNWPVISTMNEEFSKGVLLRLTWLARISSTFAGHYDLAVFLVLVLNLSLGWYLWQKQLKRSLRLGFWLWWFFSFYILVLTASRISIATFFLTVPLILIYSRKFKSLAVVLSLAMILTLQSDNLNQRFISLLPQSFKDKLAVLEIKVDTNKQKLLSFNWRQGLNQSTIQVVSPASTPEPIAFSTPIGGKPASPVQTKSQKSINQPTSTTLTSSQAATVATTAGKPASPAARPFPTPEPIAAAAARSSQIRFQVEWPRAIRAFAKNPLVGTGYTSLGLATDNDYLRLLGEVGFLGFTSFFILWLNLIYLAISNFKKVPIVAIGFLTALFSFFMSAVFIDVFESSKIAYYLWAITGMFISFNQNKNR